MRPSSLVVALLLAAPAVAGAQSLASPIDITTASYSDSRDSCPYVGSGLYFPEIGVMSDGPSVAYRLVVPTGSTLPWTVHVLPQGWDAMVAVCRRTDLTQCVDASDSGGNGYVEGVTIPAVAGTYYIVVGNGFVNFPGACGSYVLTAVR